MNETGNSNLFVHHLDLASFKSVRNFCSKIIETEPKIDVLIHNAGVSHYLHKQVSVDGIEMTMASNHYGMFLMTNLMFDHLKKMSKCRIVVVASKTHTLSYMDPTRDDHLNPIGRLPMNLYANSKLANILFTFELATRLKLLGIKHITVNCLHPGNVNYFSPFLYK